MKELIGKTIDELWVGEGEQTLYFKIGRDTTSYETEADCCSVTWFADILGVDALLGGTVIAVDDLEFPETPELSPEEQRIWEAAERTRQDYDAVYGVSITTNKGRATLAYRNSTNGYYGGSLSVAGSEPIPESARPITEDWSA